jgi:hypothetical protein
VKVPVRVPLASVLTADCPPAHLLPTQGPLRLADLLLYVEALESALLTCRVQLGKIRALDAPQQFP